ncbi:MAG: HAMP domain-containing protein [Gammaproteobacteria bacterium]|nr:MAG: HAMP domain-containing protein [Gammaproteobacteria bacterium]
MRLSIRSKLFLTLLLTSLLVSAGMLVFIQWSFDKGFVQYVQQQEKEAMARLAPRLADVWSRHGSWDFLRQNLPEWDRLMQQTLPLARPPRPALRAPSPPPPAGRPHQRERTRFALFDASQQPVIGPPDATPTGHVEPVRAQGQVIGYLALLNDRPIFDAGDLSFMTEQTESWSLIALIMTSLSLLLALPLTAHFLKPIRALNLGTQRLMAGQYDSRIPLVSGDELGALCQAFNTLAMTLEKNEGARQRWVADIAHELRTPIAILQGDIEALQDGIRPADARHLALLSDEVKHLSRLVHDLYELSMSDAGALNYQFLPTHIHALLNESIRSFVDRFDKANIQVETVIPELPCTVMADPDRLHQLFTNLLENSLRYTDIPGLVRITLSANSGSVSIQVEDSAPGVAPAHHDRLFERLYRVDTSRSRATGGAGIGLALCKNITEAHQGHITAAPSSLGGLCITITFPLAR